MKIVPLKIGENLLKKVDEFVTINRRSRKFVSRGDVIRASINTVLHDASKLKEIMKINNCDLYSGKVRVTSFKLPEHTLHKINEVVKMLKISRNNFILRCIAYFLNL